MYKKCWNEIKKQIERNSDATQLNAILQNQKMNMKKIL